MSSKQENNKRNRSSNDSFNQSVTQPAKKPLGGDLNKEVERIGVKFSQLGENQIDKRNNRKFSEERPPSKIEEQSVLKSPEIDTEEEESLLNDSLEDDSYGDSSSYRNLENQLHEAAANHLATGQPLNSTFAGLFHTQGELPSFSGSLTSVEENCENFKRQIDKINFSSTSPLVKTDKETASTKSSSSVSSTFNSVVSKVNDTFKNGNKRPSHKMEVDEAVSQQTKVFIQRKGYPSDKISKESARKIIEILNKCIADRNVYEKQDDNNIEKIAILGSDSNGGRLTVRCGDE